MVNWVGPEGPADARLLVVGDFPRWQEVRDGRPFVGAAGKILEAGFVDVGLARKLVLLTHVVGTRPNRDDWAAQGAVSVAQGMDQLRGLLSVPRTLVMGLGAVAFFACVTGEAPPASEREVERQLSKRFGGSITELRGYVFEGPYGNVLAAIHPAFIARTWLPWRACLTWDLDKAKRLCGDALQPVRISRQGGYSDVSQLLQADALAVDSEEHPDGCVSFAASAAEGITFPLDTHKDVIAELLASPVRKVFQNAQYDLTKFRRYGFQVGGEIEDIMLAWHAKEPLIAGRSESGTKSTQKSLRFLASVYTDEPYWKNYNFETAEDKWRLCATDARVTWEIWKQLR